MSNDGAEIDSHEEMDRQKAGEWIRAALSRMAPERAEKLWELNEEIRREAQEAIAGRHSRPERQRNGGRADRPTKRAARPQPRMMGTSDAGTFCDSTELVNAGTGVSTRDGTDDG